jgi:phage FluMu protein Com
MKEIVDSVLDLKPCINCGHVKVHAYYDGWGFLHIKCPECHYSWGETIKGRLLEVWEEVSAANENENKAI